MELTNYNEALAVAIQHLEYAELIIFESIVGIGFAGIYKDIFDLMEEDEEIKMEPDYFDDTEDSNIKLLYDVMWRVNKVKDSLVNLNGFDDEEMDWW